MELGGKSPLILFEDVNVEEAAGSAAFGALAFVGVRSIFISLVGGINPLYRPGKCACRPTR
jgi:acyl-CoA reductase-like NAD-dependent aldehyde dehydrogenase